MNYDQLINEAINARNNSYCPYSGYSVGAAAEFAGAPCIYKGANIENASYGATICAERVAILKAVSEGYTKLRAIAIAGAPKESNVIDTYAYPCGMCRQVMAEFGDDKTIVIVAKSVDDYEEYKLSELIPHSFEL